MKNYEDMEETELVGAVAVDCTDGENFEIDYVGKFLCLECIGDLDLSFETWSEPHTKCPRCHAKTTLYKSVTRRTLL
jgi:hypothetical protein